jgi:hypothetical protein
MLLYLLDISKDEEQILIKHGCWRKMCT